MPSNDFKHKNRTKHIAFKLGIPKEAVETILNLQSQYIKEKISEVEVDKGNLLSEEEFNEAFPIIKINPIGYLKPNYQKYKQINKNRDGQQSN